MKKSLLLLVLLSFLIPLDITFAADIPTHIVLSCRWTENGDNSLDAGTGWENYPDELFVVIDGSNARAWGNGLNAGPLFEGTHNNNAFDNGNIGFSFPDSIAFRAKSSSIRRFVYISRDLVKGKILFGKVVLYASNPLKQWGFVYFNCNVQN